MRKKDIQYKLLKYILKQFPERRLFCPIPFKQMDIMPSGEGLLCCYIKKSAGKLKNDDLYNIYNSKNAREIRESILDGTFRFCNLSNCPHFASGNLPLQKDCKNTVYEEIISKRQTFFNEMNIWVSFDPRCNLRCISCRKDFIGNSEKDTKQTELLMKSIEYNLPYIKNLGLNGNGDPLASPVTRKFLYTLDAGKYPDLSITLLTNGIFLNEDSWNSMKGAQSAIKSIQVSIDSATKETYEKIRRGGDFNKLLNNLNFISNLRKKGSLSEFIISFVVNVINYKEMEDFIKLGLNLGCDQIYFSYMVDWGVLGKSRYDDLAVHQESHPEHEYFIKLLGRPIFGKSVVMLGNVGRYRQNRLLRDSMFS